MLQIIVGVAIGIAVMFFHPDIVNNFVSCVL